MNLKNIKIVYSKKKEKVYFLQIAGGFLALYLFLRGFFLVDDWYKIFGESFILAVSLGFIYIGYKGYKKRDEEEYFDNTLELNNLVKYKIIET